MLIITAAASKIPLPLDERPSVGQIQERVVPEVEVEPHWVTAIPAINDNNMPIPVEVEELANARVVCWWRVLG